MDILLQHKLHNMLIVLTFVNRNNTVELRNICNTMQPTLAGTKDSKPKK